MSACDSRFTGFLSYINENVLLQCIIWIVFLCVFLFIYILKTYTFFSKRKILEKEIPTFPFGNIGDVVFKNISFYELIWKYYRRIRRKHYRYGGIYLFLKPGIIVVDHDLICQILSEDKKIVSANDIHLPLDYVKITNIFHSKYLSNLLHEYNQSSASESLKCNLSKNDFESVLRNFFVQTTALSFGFNTHEVLNEINDELKKYTDSSFWSILSLIYPRLKRKRYNPDLRDVLEEIWQLRKKNDIRKDDLIQAFFNILNEEQYEVDDIAMEMFRIFVENLIYCHSLSTFCLLEMANNADIQEELRGEIRRFKKEATELNMENICKLKYLDCVVKETLRKYPQVPYLLLKSKESYKLTDRLELDQGMPILISVFGIHYDTENYVDPARFDPDRFVESNRERKNIFLPFGCDKRSEIKMNFTMLHVKLGLLTILSSFKVEWASSSSANIIEFDSNQTTVQAKAPYSLQFSLL